MTTEEKNAGKVGMSAFNVSKKANEGVKLSLTLPDGTPTDEYLIIRGADSVEFRNQQARFNRDRFEMVRAIKKEDPVELAKKEADLERRLVASLVAGWSFPEECNEANICKFLADAPQIQLQIDNFAGDRVNFFVKPPQD